MRQPNGRMSKKDRRALLAFGIMPSDDQQPRRQPEIIFDNFATADTAWIKIDTASMQNGNWVYATNPVRPGSNMTFSVGSLRISLQ